MSLQIWLPLNKNLQNKGLIPVSATNNGATVNNNGKIGKCYSFGGSNYLTLPTSILENFTGDISCCAWINISAWNTQYDSIVKMYANNNAWQNSIFAMGRNGSTNKLYFSIANGSSSTQANCTLTENASLNTWYHMACTYDSTNKKMKIYLNGELKVTYSTTIVPNFNIVTSIGIGGSPLASYGLKGLLNDFRLYNHVLSLRQIKEISKGLIIHYSLDNNGLGNQNLLTKYISPGSAAPGSTAMSGRTEYYGDYGIIIPAQQNSDTYFSLYSASQLVLGETYTISCYVKNLLEGSRYHFPLFAQNNGTMGILKLNHNGLCSMTFTMSYEGSIPTATIDGMTVYRCFLDDSDRLIASGQGPITVTNFKIEKGSKATFWIPLINNNNNNNIIYDLSGYEYNSTFTNLTYSIDTPKQYVSSNFDGDTSVISLGNISSLLQNQFTVNLWFKKSELGSKGYETLFGGPSGFEMDTKQGSQTTLKLYMASTRGGTVFSPFNFNQWYMVTMVNDGTNELYYINGELKKTIEKKAMPNGNYFIGSWSSTTSQNYKGLISDFRIYATPLNAQEILKLYQTSILADRSGNLYSYDITQQDNKKLFSRQNISFFKDYTETSVINPNIMPNSVNMALGSANSGTGTWRLAGTSNMSRSRVAITDAPIGICYGFQSSGIQNANTNDTSCYGIDSFPFEANTDYVISFWARKTSGTQAYAGFSIYNCTYGEGSDIRFQQQYYITALPQDGSWIRCWKQFKTNSSTNRNIYIGITTGTQSATAQICAVKIEKGILLTQWIPKQTDENYEQYRIKDNTITINRQNYIFANSFYEI